MGERPPDDDRLSDFQSRLERLKDEQAVRMGQSGGTPGLASGYGMAFTIAAELVGGLIGGALIGWLVDRWLDSAPLGLITFFFVGAIAGLWNVYRTVRAVRYDSRLPAPSQDGPGAGPRRGNEDPGRHAAD